MPLMLAVLLALASPQDRRDACPRVECSEECWRVRVTFRQVVSAPGAPVAHVTAQAVVGGPWGSMEGARCYADQLGREGFWRDAEDVPTPGPEKIPAGAVELLQIQERPF